MKGEDKIFLLSMVIGLVACAIEFLIDRVLFCRDFSLLQLISSDLWLANIEHYMLTMAAFFCFGLIVGRAFRRRREAEQNLAASNEELQASNQQLMAGEQQLRASNQQLKAADQQLRAGELQLRAANQQLEANNQQLRAAEQQLSAGNQQLIESESALRLEKDMAQMYLDVANVIVLLVNADQTVGMINRKGCELLGCPEEEILQNNWFDNFLPDDSVEDSKDLFKDLLAGKTEMVEYQESPIRASSGQKRVIAWHNSVIRNNDGSIASILSSGVDVTKQKAVEEHERELLERLSRSERMESLGVLAGGVAHDLNNILIPMLALPEIIMEELDEILGKYDVDLQDIKEDLVSIRNTGRIASEIVHDLLTLSRRGHYEKTPLFFADVIRDYIKSPVFVTLDKNNPNVKITVGLPKEPLAIMGSEPHLLQVVMNLVMNAVESIPHGGEVGINLSNVYMEKSSTRYDSIAEGDYVVLRVTDTGGGIAENDLGRIFEPFYTKKKMGRLSGTGLGLAVTYGTVNDHNGCVDVKSKKGEGAEFVIYLPVCRESVEEEKGHGNVEGGNETILIVDDMQQQRDVATRILTRLGYAAQTAENGREAVALFSEAKKNKKPSPCDLILLDMIMEDDFDGVDTFDEISKIFPGQKCIIVSGFSETKRIKDSQKLGVGRFLAKPYTVGSLAMAVRRELDAANPASSVESVGEKK